MVSDEEVCAGVHVSVRVCIHSFGMNSHLLNLCNHDVDVYTFTCELHPFVGIDVTRIAIYMVMGCCAFGCANCYGQQKVDSFAFQCFPKVERKNKSKLSREWTGSPQDR